MLLAAPVNATWAANHTAYWLERGFRGFLFRGLFDTLEATDPARGLAREIRLANARLVEAGIDRNFLHLAIAPEEHWFLERSLFRSAVEGFRRMGDFCQRTGLQGIALDTRPAAFLYDYRWDGYDLEDTSPGRLRQRARDFGRRTLRAFIGACPECEVLVIADDLSRVGPLWFDFFEGCVESIGAALTVRVHLLLCAGPGDESPEQLHRLLADARSLVELRFSDANRRLWDGQGSVALGLRPVGYREGLPVAYCSPEAFRLQLCAAKTLCPDYVWIAAPKGGWWQVTAREARSYAHLKQGDPAAVRETRPLLDTIDAYATRTPLDPLLRVGSLDSKTYVLRSESGAAVLFWQGIAEERRESDRSTPLKVTDLRTGEARWAAPRDGEAVLETVEGPVLVDGLAIRDWVLPAGLRLWLEDSLSPKTRRTNAHFAFTNMTDLTIRGTLEAWPPENYSIGSASFPLHLEAGESASHQRTLQGVFRLGDAPEFGLAVAVPGSGVSTRRFRFDVLPGLDWYAPRDGPLSGPPALLDFDNDGMLESVVSSRWGDVACYDGTGQLLWERRFRGRFDLPPVAGRGEAGQAVIVLADHHGTLRALDTHGAVIGEMELGAPCLPGGLFLGDLRQTVFDVLVAALTDGRIICTTFHTGTFWEYNTGAQTIHLGHVGDYLAEDGVSVDNALRLVSGRTYAALSGRNAELLCLSPSGRRIWRRPCPAPAACAPQIVHFPGDNVARLLLGDDRGVIQHWDAFLGRLDHQVSTGAGSPICGLAVGDVHQARGTETLALDKSGVHCIAATGERLWHTPISGAQHLVLQPFPGAPVLLVSTVSGVLYGLSGNGAIQWRDDRAAAAITGRPATADIDADRNIECLCASADRTLRVFELVPIRLPPSRLQKVSVDQKENPE